jgi:hypothetical protein
MYIQQIQQIISFYDYEHLYSTAKQKALAHLSKK